MTAVPVTSPSRRGLPARLIGDWTIGFLVFLSGFVIVEPAPYDLVLCGVMAVWAFCGFTISRPILPLVVLLIFYCAGGLLSFTQIKDFSESFVYWATTLFLVLQCIFFAGVVPVDPKRRFNVIAKAYIASAVVASLFGILGYFGAIPYASLFTLYDRARGTFQDPNVFAPFLVLPLVVLARAMLTRPFAEGLMRAPALLIILFGIFLSFSRAAWGMTVLALLITAALAVATEENNKARLRMLGVLIGGFAFLVLLFAIAIHIPAIQDLVVQRATLVQDYDGGRFGRFARHLIGLGMIPEHPLGVGPFVFGRMWGEDEHNMWLKGFMVYGWLGGFSYIALVAWTLWISIPLLVRRTPWQGFVQCAFAVYIGHLMIHFVIDNDHWRHIFLIYGLLWAAYAVDRRSRVQAARERAGPALTPFAAR